MAVMDLNQDLPGREACAISSRPETLKYFLSEMPLSGVLVGDSPESILIHKTVHGLWFFKKIIR